MGNDHCFVPHKYPQNQKLSQWVRKQRNQRKRKERGLHSTLSDERQEMLTNAGFIWDSHRAQWQERYQSLEMFHMKWSFQCPVEFLRFLPFELGQEPEETVPAVQGWFDDGNGRRTDRIAELPRFQLEPSRPLKPVDSFQRSG